MVEPGLDTDVELVTVAGRELAMHRPRRGIDALLDERAATAEADGIPYWAQLWPAARALAAYLVAVPLGGVTVLELGCGSGLAGLAARLGGAAAVVQTDVAPDALELARRSARASGVDGVAQRLLDWRAPPADLGRFGLVIGADILYEDAFAAPLLALLERVLLPGGQVVLADPCRASGERFVERARAHYAVTTIRAPLPGTSHTIAIHVLEPTGGATGSSP